MEKPKHSGVRFGAFEVDLLSGDLRRKSGSLVKLPPQSLSVLNLLVRNAAQLVTRKELQEQLWKHETTVDFEQGLNCCIKQIRASLGDTADEPRFIQTHYRRGYRFIAPVETVPESADESVSSLHDRPRRIAVLPFQNVNPDASQNYFADGLTDVLITNIAKLKTLGVISRTSMMGYRQTRKRVPSIAKELNVDYLLGGTVLRSGSQIRVTVQLIEGRTDRHVWADTYERYCGRYTGRPKRHRNDSCE